MIITCPECKTRYMIKSERLGADSKKVRCAKCKHQWNIAAESGAEKESSSEKPPLPPIARLHSPSLKDQQKVLNNKIKQRKKIMFVILGASLAVFIASLLIFKDKIIQNNPQLSSIYQLLGFNIEEESFDVAGLIIENVERQQEQFSDMTVLSFSGAIKNTSQVEVPVPNVNVQLFNEDGVLLDEWEAEPDHKTLKSGESTTWICRFFNPKLDQISKFKTNLIQAK